MEGSIRQIVYLHGFGVMASVVLVWIRYVLFSEEVEPQVRATDQKRERKNWLTFGNYRRNKDKFYP